MNRYYYNILVEFLSKTIVDILTFFRSHEEVHGFDIWARSEQFLHQHFTQESGASSYKHGAISIELGNVTIIIIIPFHDEEMLLLLQE